VRSDTSVAQITPRTRGTSHRRRAVLES
jgi:hypothetical protein